MTPQALVRASTASPVCVSRQTTTMAVGEPPNHVLISPSPTKSAARCEPSGSMTQTGWPLWNWPSPTLVIDAQLDADHRKTLFGEHTGESPAWGLPPAAYSFFSHRAGRWRPPDQRLLIIVISTPTLSAD